MRFNNLAAFGMIFDKDRNDFEKKLKIFPSSFLL